jgi:hypothetical protein
MVKSNEWLQQPYGSMIHKKKPCRNKFPNPIVLAEKFHSQLQFNNDCNNQPLIILMVEDDLCGWASQLVNHLKSWNLIIFSNSLYKDIPNRWIPICCWNSVIQLQYPPKCTKKALCLSWIPSLSSWFIHTSPFSISLPEPLYA